LGLTLFPFLKKILDSKHKFKLNHSQNLKRTHNLVFYQNYKKHSLEDWQILKDFLQRQTTSMFEILVVYQSYKKNEYKIKQQKVCNKIEMKRKEFTKQKLC
jgi:hypothetical protein